MRRFVRTSVVGLFGLVACLALSYVPVGAESAATASLPLPRFDYKIPSAVHHNELHSIRVQTPDGKPMANGYKVSVNWLVDGKSYRANGTVAGGRAQVRMTFPPALTGKVSKMWLVGHPTSQYGRVSTPAKSVALGYSTNLKVDFYGVPKSSAVVTWDELADFDFLELMGLTNESQPSGPRQLEPNGVVVVTPRDNRTGKPAFHAQQRVTVDIRVRAKTYTYRGEPGKAIRLNLPESTRGHTATVTASVTASPDGFYPRAIFAPEHHVVK